MGRKPCCSKEGLNRGAWTAMEDKILVSYIKSHGEGKWGSLPKRAGLKRCGKSCRLRWLNYLRPGIKRGNISDDEEELIIRLHRLLGNRWSLIAGRLPGRTDNEIKNYWNTTLCKRVQSSNHTNQCIAVGKCRPKVQTRNTDATCRSPEHDTNPIRTKALRCTRVLGTTAAATTSHEHIIEAGTKDHEEMVEQKKDLSEDLSIGSIDLDLDLDLDLDFELNFLSPWQGEGGTEFGGGMVSDSVGPLDDAELEDLLGAGDLEQPWL